MEGRRTEGRGLEVKDKKDRRMEGKAGCKEEGWKEGRKEGRTEGRKNRRTEEG